MKEMVVITSLVVDDADVTLGARGYQRASVVDSAVFFPSCGETPSLVCVLSPGDDYFLPTDGLTTCAQVAAEMNSIGCTADPATAWTGPGADVSVTSPNGPDSCRLRWNGTAWAVLPV